MQTMLYTGTTIENKTIHKKSIKNCYVSKDLSVLQVVGSDTDTSRYDCALVKWNTFYMILKREFLTPTRKCKIIGSACRQPVLMMMKILAQCCYPTILEQNVTLRLKITESMVYLYQVDVESYAR